MAIRNEIYLLDTTKDVGSANVISSANRDDKDVNPFVEGDRINMTVRLLDEDGYIDSLNGNSSYSLTAAIRDYNNDSLLAYSNNFLPSASYGWTGSISLDTDEITGSLTGHRYIRPYLHFQFTNTGGDSGKDSVLLTPIQINFSPTAVSTIPSPTPNYLTEAESDARYATIATSTGGWVSGSGQTNTHPTVTRVGINQSSPTGALDVVGTTNLSGALSVVGTGTISGTFTGAGSVVGARVTGSTGIYTPSLTTINQSTSHTGSFGRLRVSADTLSTPTTIATVGGALSLTGSDASLALYDRTDQSRNGWSIRADDNLIFRNMLVADRVQFSRLGGITATQLTSSTGNITTLSGTESTFTRVTGSFANIGQVTGSITGARADIGSITCDRITGSFAGPNYLGITQIRRSTPLSGITLTVLGNVGITGSVGDNCLLLYDDGSGTPWLLQPNSNNFILRRNFADRWTLSPDGDVTGSSNRTWHIPGGTISGSKLQSSGLSTLTQAQIGSNLDSIADTKLLVGPSTTGLSAMRIATGSAPSAPIHGDLWKTTASPSNLSLRQGSTSVGLVGCNYANTGANVSRDASAGSGDQTLFTTTIGGGTLQVGSVIEVDAWGTYNYDTATTGAMQWKLVVGSTAYSFGTFTPSATANKHWNVRATMRVTTIGASGEIWAQAKMEYINGTTSLVTLPLNRTTAMSIDTTVDRLFGLYWAMNSGVSADNVTLTNATVKLYGAG